MKRKKLLFSLMALLLPLTTWAAEGDPVLNKFVVTLTGELEGKTAVDYSGSVNVGVKVTYSYKTPQGIQTSELTEGTHFTVSYDYTPFVGQAQTGLEATGVKDAGKYTVNVTGTGLYAEESGIAAFTINRVPLTLTDQIVKNGARIQYGTTDEELKSLNIADYITLGNANGLVNTTSQQEEELADALRCLTLTYAAGTEEEGAKGATLLKVGANTPNGSTNYEYKGDGVYVKVNIDKKVLTLSLDKTAHEYDGKTYTAESLIKGLDFVEKDLTANAVSAIYTVTKKDSEETDIKNAGEYTIVVSLTGPAKDNYEFANKKGEEEEVELIYTIDRKVIDIKTNDGAELSKVYDGKVVSTGDVAKFYTIDPTVEGDNIEVTMQPSGATKTVVDAGDNVVTIAPYVNGHQIQSKNWSAPETDWEAPTALSNYAITIDGRSTSGALPKFTIKKRPVLFYFAGDKKIYQTTGITNTTLKDYYKVEVLTADNTGFVTHPSTTEGVEPTKDAFKQAPVAKFADEIEEAKAIAKYELAWDEDTKVTYSDDSENYEAIFVNVENEQYADLIADIDTANVFEITMREVVFKALDKEIAYGADLSELDEYLKISVNTIKKEDEIDGNTNIVRGLLASTSTDLPKIVRELGDALVIDPKVDLTTVGTKEGAIKFKVENATIEVDGTYIVKLEPGDLIVKGAESITLDALAGESTGDEDEVEPAKTVEELVYAYNGQKVDKVTIKNLKNNFIGSTEDGNKYDYEINQTLDPEKWYTLVLPFDVTVAELSRNFGYAIVNIPNEANDDKNAVYFKLTMQTVPANTLMAFKVAEKMDWSEIKGVEFEEKTIVAPTEDWKWAEDIAGNVFRGVYKKETITDENDFFWSAKAGKAVSAAAVVRNYDHGVDVYPLNGYVHFEDKTPNAVRYIYMEEADGSTTAINVVTKDTINNNAEGWYTVGGMKLEGQPTQKGVYINNGKKVVIK